MQTAKQGNKRTHYISHTHTHTGKHREREGGERSDRQVKVPWDKLTLSLSKPSVESHWWWESVTSSLKHSLISWKRETVSEVDSARPLSERFLVFHPNLVMCRQDSALTLHNHLATSPGRLTWVITVHPLYFLLVLEHCNSRAPVWQLFLVSPKGNNLPSGKSSHRKKDGFPACQVTVVTWRGWSRGAMVWEKKVYSGCHEKVSSISVNSVRKKSLKCKADSQKVHLDNKF